MSGPRWDHPCGWLLKPDFKRKEQRRATIDNSNISTTSFKLKSLFSSTYKRRWFVLCRERSVLEYFAAENSAAVQATHQTPLGQINLKSVISIRPSIVVDAPNHSLDLICTDIHYTIVPESLEEKNYWMVVLNRELKSIEDWNTICELENRINQRLTNKSPTNASKYDYSPLELCSALLSFHRPTTAVKEVSPGLYEFFSNVIRCLLIPSVADQSTTHTVRTNCCTKPCFGISILIVVNTFTAISLYFVLDFVINDLYSHLCLLLLVIFRFVICCQA